MAAAPPPKRRRVEAAAIKCTGKCGKKQPASSFAPSMRLRPGRRAEAVCAACRPRVKANSAAQRAARRRNFARAAAERAVGVLLSPVGNARRTAQVFASQSAAARHLGVTEAAVRKARRSRAAVTGRGGAQYTVRIVRRARRAAAAAGRPAAAAGRAAAATAAGLRPLRVAVLRGSGCFPPCVDAAARAFALPAVRATFDVRRVLVGAVAAGALRGCDVIVAPGGDDRRNWKEGVRKGQVAALGARGRAALRAAVRGGATYVGVCAGAFTAMRGEVGLAPYAPVDEQAFGIDDVRGEVTLRRNPRAPPALLRAAQALALGGEATVLYAQGPVIRELPKVRWPRGAGAPVTLCTYAAPVRPDAACRAGRSRRAFAAAREAMRGAPAVTHSSYGAGAVLLVGPHMELNDEARVQAVLPRLVLAARGRLPAA